MSLSYYNKEGKRLITIAGGQRLWIGTKAAHDLAVVANKLPNNILIGMLENGLYYRDDEGVEKLITVGTGDITQIQVTAMPTANEESEGRVVQYIGITGGDVIHGYFYECVGDGAGNYEWKNLPVGAGGSGDDAQVATLPTPGVNEYKNIYQYIGDTTEELTRGYFYECVYEGDTYVWKEINVSQGIQDYDELENIPKINDVEVKGEKPSSDFYLETAFIGTTEDWAALTEEEQAKYHVIHFTDDYTTGADGGGSGTGNADISITGPYTLKASDWVDNKQTVEVVLDLDARNVVDITVAELKTWAEYQIYAISEDAVSITFSCETVPEVDLTFKVATMSSGKSTLDESYGTTDRIFRGSKAEYEALSSEEQEKYTIMLFTDPVEEDIPIATTEAAGIVKPDGETIAVDADGTIRAVIKGNTTLPDYITESRTGTITFIGREFPDGEYSDTETQLITFDEPFSTTDYTFSFDYSSVVNNTTIIDQGISNKTVNGASITFTVEVAEGSGITTFPETTITYTAYKVASLEDIGNDIIELKTKDTELEEKIEEINDRKYVRTDLMSLTELSTTDVDVDIPEGTEYIRVRFYGKNSNGDVMPFDDREIPIAAIKFQATNDPSPTSVYSLTQSWFIATYTTHWVRIVFSFGQHGTNAQLSNNEGTPFMRWHKSGNGWTNYTLKSTDKIDVQAVIRK